MTSQHNKSACPICRAGVTRGETPDWPFCSPRCRDLDLGRWLKGAYRIPTDEGPEAAPAPPEAGLENEE